MKNVAFALSLPHRAVAMATLFALLAWTMGLPAWINTAEAANVTQFSDTLSDSDLGVDSLHTIFFTAPNGMSAGQSFRIYFDQAGSNFGFGGVLDTDLIATSTGFAATTTCSAVASEIDLSVGANYIEGIVCAGDTIASSTRIGMQIGNVNRINNPATANSYIISLQGVTASPIPDTGDTRVAIIDDVTVTASVSTIFIFSINGVNAGVTVNGDAVPTTGTSTATTVPFGVISPGGANARVMAQELRVDTNAYNGFAVTVFADQTLTAGNGATINPFIDGASTTVPQAWVGPTGTFGSPDTYGHWGLTSDDTLAGDPFGSALYMGDFFLNPVEVFYNNAATRSTSGLGVGSTTVAYKVEVTVLQEAANDYTATLTYIATPVF